MKFNTENPIKKVLDLYLNDVSGQTPAIREKQVLEAVQELQEAHEEQDKIVKILNDNKQAWDYAPSDGVLQLVERLREYETLYNDVAAKLNTANHRLSQIRELCVSSI
jgi:archaellum component FlaC